MYLHLAAGHYYSVLFCFPHIQETKMSKGNPYWTVLKLASQARTLDQDKFPEWLAAIDGLLPEIDTSHLSIEHRIIVSALLQAAINANFSDASKALELFSRHENFRITQLTRAASESRTLRDNLFERVSKFPEQFSETSIAELIHLLQSMVGQDYVTRTERNLAHALLFRQPELPDTLLAQVVEVFCLQLCYSFEQDAFTPSSKRLSALLVHGGPKTRTSLCGTLLKISRMQSASKPDANLISKAEAVAINRS